jgi:hypothetical protein
MLCSRFSPCIDKITGIISVGSNSRSTTDHICFCIHQILEKKWKYNETVHQLFINLKKAYDTVRRKVLYSNLIQFWVPMKLARLIKMCLNQTYSKLHIDKYLCDTSPIRYHLKQEMINSPCFETLL